MQVDRRAFLASAVAAGALAGCLGGSEADADSMSTPTNPSTDGTASATDLSANGTTSAQPPAASIDHPALAALAGQPYRGPAPGAAPNLIVAFEDPSCTNCERFNTGTLPKLESEIVEPGEATYVYRNFPYAYDWGKPAMQALEATDARSEAAFWELKTYYFETQSEFSNSNVLDRTQEFLASETDLDAAAVVADAEAEEFNAAVQRDIDAGENAGVVSTPTFYLFSGGEFLTEIRGAQSYEVFEQALGV
ncbi:thioredoxin [Halobacteriales archaeon QH_9_66_26]|nr:MAG: thioredoxin [Halobacteriales archaeon QH_9_66_26]